MVKKLDKETLEHKRDRKALRESEEKYRLLVNNLPSIVFKGYKDWSVEFFDNKIESLTGYNVDEFNSRRMKWSNLILKKDIETSRQSFIQALKTDKSYIRKYRIKPKTGDIKWIQERGQMVCDDKGEIEYISGVFFDVEDRKQAEESLRKSEKKYRTLLETTSEGYWMLNPERKTIEINESLCKMLGYSQDEMLGKTPFDFVDDENRKIFITQTSKISDTEHRSYEITLKKKNGQNLRTYFNATTIRDESGEIQGSFAFVTDITERKQAEEELNRLVVAIEQVAESVFITDRDGMIQYVNPTFERLTGYSRKDAVGQNPRILKSGKHDALFYKQMWDTLTSGIAWHGRFINKKKDGSFYEADATIS
ncbi:MAG: PAS domain S-box protein, partial [Deltaproteobacteria bacterium]|nr:PAS domain S-box protein [Deltaproteobacteria bacterium]